MAEPKEETDNERHWLLWIFGAVLALFGLAMAAGGAWLVILGGSWYYLLAGIGLTISGIELMRGRMAGAWWFAAVFTGTLLWTIWEAGLDYWRSIPRFALIVVFAFILALLLPKLRRGPSMKMAGSLAALLALIFIGFFALAFLPHGVTKAGWSQASPAGGIRVIDLATGNTIWDRPFGRARSNGPFGIPSKLPIPIGDYVIAYALPE